MPNPSLIGEFQKFYYKYGDYDLTVVDDAILSDLSWSELCIINLDITNTFTEHTFNDTCTPDIETVAPGRRQVGMSFEVNSLRHTDAEIRAWQTAVDSRNIIGVLALVSERTDADTYGFVANMVYSQADETRPQEGAITESYTIRPAAKSAYTPTVRRIYGANIT